MTSFLVTGVAGFIGFHVARRLIGRGDDVVGVDNLNDYYDPTLKEARLNQLTGYPNFRFVREDIAERPAMTTLFDAVDCEVVIHLAAQAGVRYSITNPHVYIDANITGFLNVLEGCRHREVKHLVYASSSSVYGANMKLPFMVGDAVDHPISLYAATKKANELMAHTYSHLYALPTTGLRFFTVYGPWGRPDMSMFLFTKAILEGRPIRVFNHGAMRRDFTYVDDIVEGVLRVADRIPGPEVVPGVNSSAPCRLYNIGNNAPVELLEMIATIERAVGRSAVKEMLPMQPGDVQATYADVESLAADVGFRPSTSLSTGVERFVSWYRDYYQV